MGCAISFNSGKINLSPKKVFDFSFPFEKSAKIGIYLLGDEATKHSPADLLFIQLKYSIQPLEVLRSDPKIFSKLRKVLIKGPSKESRWILWKFMLDVKTFDEYQTLSTEKNASNEVLLKDINRTFPTHDYFSKEKFGHFGQYALYRVLGKFSSQYPQVGYCQGMNYIVGFLLIVSGSKEAEVYALFVRICEEFNLFGVFSESMEELHKNLWVFERILESHYPELYSHFNDEELTKDMWIFKWMLSLFTTSLPLRLVVVVWDYFIAKGLKGLYQVSLGILRILKSQLIKKDLQEVLLTFEALTDTQISAHRLLKSISKVKLKTSRIENLRKKYDQEQASKPQSPKPQLDIKLKHKPSQNSHNLVIQEITETLEDIPPFQKSKSGFTTPHRTPNGASAHKMFDYLQMGRISFIEERTPNDDETVNAKQFLDDLVNEKTPGDSFIIQVYTDRP